MRTKKVLIEQSFTKMDEGKRLKYLGTLKIGGVLFSYEAKIAPSVDMKSESEMDRIFNLVFGTEQETEQARQDYFGIYVSIGENELVLSTKEYAFFASLVIPFSHGFFSRPEVATAIILKKKIDGKRVRVSGLQTISSVSYLTISENEIQLLESRFGCRFS